jgi:hypothetical protein
MRTLGIALCTASLALSTGGVSLQPAAAGEPPAAEQVREYPSAAAPELPNSCQRDEQTPVAVELPTERMRAEAAAMQFENLNTRGYNYPAPDDPPERYVPDSTGLPRPQPPQTQTQAR